MADEYWDEWDRLTPPVSFDAMVESLDPSSRRRSSVGVVGDQDMPQTKEVARVSEYESKVEVLRQALAEFAGIQSLMDRFGGQEPPIGTVLRWVKQYDSRRGQLVMDRSGSGSATSELRFDIEAPSEYVFVAFRAPNGSWYTTSQRGSAGAHDWDKMLKDIGDSQCELVSDWVEVPAPEKPDTAALDPLAFARNMFGKKDVPAES